MTLRYQYSVIPGERSEGRGSIHTRNASSPPRKERGKEASRLDEADSVEPWSGVSKDEAGR
jgi:hypothetical protein